MVERRAWRADVFIGAGGDELLSVGTKGTFEGGREMESSRYHKGLQPRRRLRLLGMAMPNIRMYRRAVGGAGCESWQKKCTPKAKSEGAISGDYYSSFDLVRILRSFS